MSKDLDHVWKALSDPTRRKILDPLRGGPCQTTEIVDKFPVTEGPGISSFQKDADGDVFHTYSSLPSSATQERF